MHGESRYGCHPATCNTTKLEHTQIYFHDSYLERPPRSWQRAQQRQQRPAPVVNNPVHETLEHFIQLNFRDRRLIVGQRSADRVADSVPPFGSCMAHRCQPAT